VNWHRNPKIPKTSLYECQKLTVTLKPDIKKAWNKALDESNISDITFIKPGSKLQCK